MSHGHDETVPMRPRERPEALALTAPVDNPATALPRGTQVGRYLLLEPLGEGGMGIVYAAYDPELDRRIAVKLLRASGGSAGSGGAGRLLREAQAMARLTHVNVVQVFDVGQVDDGVFIAMELVEGWTLREWQRQPGRPLAELLEAYLAAGRGLVAAHAAGLVHRDFKPDNVLVGRDRRVRVTDFGLVRAAQPDDASRRVPAIPAVSELAATPGPSPLSGELTAAGAVLGTPHYMAPEQHQGRVADARSDQFGYCVALWEGLTGERPFAGETMAELAEACLRAPKLPAGTRLPPRLLRALERGLHAEPDRRWPSMAELLVELEAAVRRRGRQTWIFAAGVVLVGVVALVAWRGGRSTALSPCLNTDEPLRARWNDGLRGEIRAAFTATGAPFAGDAFATASRELDGFAGRWAAMARESCEATRVSHAQSERLGDRRSACLAARLDEASALVERLRRADRQTVLRTVEMLGRLPDLEPCADAAALESRAPRPGSPAIREVETRLAALRAELGEDEPVDPARAAALVEEAAALGWAPLSASALLARAEVEADLGKGDEARPSVLAAAAAALRGGDDERLADALLTLVHVDLELRGRYPDARSSLDLADAAVARLARPGRARLRLHRERGLLLIAEAEPAAARVELDKALALATTRADELDLIVDLATAQRGEGELEAAIELMVRAARLGLELYGPSHPRMATVYHDHAAILFDLGRYEDARPLAEQALRIREAAFGKDDRMVGRTLELLGVIYLRLGRLDDGLAALSRAVAIAEKGSGPDHLDTAGALSELGGALHARGDYQGALQVNRRVLAIRETHLGQDHPEVGYTLVNLAVEAKALGKMADVEASYRRALAIFAAKLGEDHFVNVVVWNNLGEALRAMGRLGEAMDAYARGEAIARQSLPEDHPIFGHLWNGMGLVELDRGRKAKAIELLEKALAIRAAQPGDIEELAETRFALARALGKNPRSRQLAEEARAGYDQLGPAFVKPRDACAAWLR